ncbi:MAG: GatB/YqeY domain-containing protein, partial [Paracoccaceae bacterium]
MAMRERLQDEIKTAMKARAAERLSGLRLIAGAIKDREIALRAEGGEVTDTDILGILGKMVKQRQESARLYVEGGRLEL